MDLNIKKSDSFSDLMEERGIREDDVREVLEYAESQGKKFYIEGEDRFLAKKRIGNFTVYVEYLGTGSEIEPLNTYSHTVSLAAEQ